MMLRELKAFEACWLDLKDVYPTSGQDNMEIAHAMGQLVDCLAKPNQIEQDLPNHLQGLFRRLALAYFQGYSAAEGQVAATVVPLPIPQPCPQSDRQRRQDISAAVERVKALAQQTQSRICAARGQVAQCATSDMETLIIEFSD
ncbi:hypothetical protein VB780_24100 [Leptolyngbya sp. CCNP1308]|uniref:hypothetical protein n=1 Tax=Leptolyngbya sp. CCNP1308 TaxID=3110255 RepID=UPI002B2062E4|nr:hypothetical protein [Leptolyngbya sp. CCNP1308]MEA5451680.1 hypothetical protein [Leptolyngbya sp. CCNP1308]